MKEAFEFNLNYEVKIKVKEAGRKILIDYYNTPGLPSWIKFDSQGWTEMQLWVVMSIFGPHLSNGMDQPIETGILILLEKAL